VSTDQYPVGRIPGAAPCIECKHTLDDHNGEDSCCDRCDCAGYSAPWDAFDYVNR
jgi:hypothetical protein